ncbi:MAG: hypothetical protein JRD89_14550 [Deltaproteobacteria bacterium]|nr:hypothetical protein [Deltaproteobacteria bacterium]
MNTIDEICGFDRYTNSIRRGELEVPIALLWKRPGCKAVAKNLTGALAHGEAVEILEKKQVKRTTYIRVRGIGHDEKQKGWVSPSLLLDEGLKVQGITEIE